MPPNVSQHSVNETETCFSGPNVSNSQKNSANCHAPDKSLQSQSVIIDSANCHMQPIVTVEVLALIHLIVK